MNVEAALERARAFGFLGPGPVEDHIAHALGFAAAVPGIPSIAADLGTGGGVPALVLAEHWPNTSWRLVEVMQRRAAFLREAIASLGFAGRVVVDDRRAEEVGRDLSLRHTFDLVTARGFGPPAPTAECGAPLLRLGGALIVSEPPEPDRTRWPSEGTAVLGLGAPHVVTHGARFVRFRQEHLCPDNFPRRVGMPNKRPLW